MGSLNFIFFLVILSSISLGSAGLGTFQQDTCVEIRTVLNTTSVNISSLGYPNNTVIYINDLMTQNAQTFNYTFCDTAPLGVYVYDYFDVEGNVYVNSFTITDIKKEVGIGTAITYLLLITFFSLIALVSIYFSITVPFSNEEHQKGQTIIIIPTKKKYVKMGFIVVSYAVITWVLNLFFILSKNFVGETAFSSAIELMFNIMMRIAYPFLIFMFVYAIYNLIKDFDLKKTGERAIKGLNLK